MQAKARGVTGAEDTGWSAWGSQEYMMQAEVHGVIGHRMLETRGATGKGTLEVQKSHRGRINGTD